MKKLLYLCALMPVLLFAGTWKKVNDPNISWDELEKLIKKNSVAGGRAIAGLQMTMRCMTPEFAYMQGYWLWRRGNKKRRSARSQMARALYRFHLVPEKERSKWYRKTLDFLAKNDKAFKDIRKKMAVADDPDKAVMDACKAAGIWNDKSSKQEDDFLKRRLVNGRWQWE